jgi:hypothetical protein
MTADEDDKLRNDPSSAGVVPAERDADLPDLDDAAGDDPADGATVVQEIPGGIMEEIAKGTRPPLPAAGAPAVPAISRSGLPRLDAPRHSTAGGTHIMNAAEALAARAKGAPAPETRDEPEDEQDEDNIDSITFDAEPTPPPPGAGQDIYPPPTAHLSIEAAPPGTTGAAGALMVTQEMTTQAIFGPTHAAAFQPVHAPTRAHYPPPIYDGSLTPVGFEEVQPSGIGWAIGGIIVGLVLLGVLVALIVLLLQRL